MARAGDREALVARSPEAHRQAGIDVRLRHEVVAIDPARREVVARDLAGGGEVRESYDHLVYATGVSEPRTRGCLRTFSPPWTPVSHALIAYVMTVYADIRRT